MKLNKIQHKKDLIAHCSQTQLNQTNFTFNKILTTASEEKRIKEPNSVLSKCLGKSDGVVNSTLPWGVFVKKSTC